MEIAIDTTTEKEFCGDNRNNRNRFNYLDTKNKNFSNMLNGLKEDRLIKYFGSDGLLHLLKNIHNKIDSSYINIPKNISKNISRKYQTFEFYNKLLVNTDNFIFSDNYIIPNEILVSILRNAESFIKDISKVSYIKFAEKHSLLGNLESIISEIKAIEKKLVEIIDEKFHLKNIDLLLNYELNDVYKEMGYSIA